MSGAAQKELVRLAARKEVHKGEGLSEFKQSFDQEE